MAVNLVVNGVSYSFPNTGEELWGDSATNWATAITSGMLQKAGGTFTLTAEVDFGTSWGLKSLYFKGRTANPAAAGVVRLAFTDVMAWRNTGNSRDLALSVDASDRILFDGNVLATVGGAGIVWGVSNGGTGKTSFNAGEIVYKGAAGATLLGLAPGSQDQTLRINASLVPEYTFVTNAMMAAAAGVALNKLAALTATKAVVSDGSGFLSASTATGYQKLSSGTPSAVTTIPIADGGTGAGTKAAAFDALSPMDAIGQLIYGGASGTGTKLPAGTSGQYLKSTGGAAPAWTTFTQPTVQNFTATGTTTGWLFTISTSSTVAVGDTYTNNGNTYTVVYALTAQTGAVFFGTNASAPQASGTLTRATGAGTASITFTSRVATATYTTPAGCTLLRVRQVGGGGGGGGAGTANGTTGGDGGSTAFGTRLSGGGGGTVRLTVGSGGANSGSGYTVLIDVSGQSGGGGGINPTTANGSQCPGGAGGSSVLGGGGGAGTAGGDGNDARTNSGSGGSGAGNDNTNAERSGGGGGAGAYLDFLITSPAATYPYVVGAAGAAGTAGTSGRPGGAGAAGYISVQEFYQ